MALFGAFAVVLAACSSPDPVLYTIAPVAGPTKIGGPKVVVIERVQVANYLDRLQIVRSSEDYRVDLKSNDWWGEALSSMLRRIVQQELAQRLPQSAVLSETGAVSASPDATIDIEFQRLDGDHAGNVRATGPGERQLQGQPDADLEKLPLLGAVANARRRGRDPAVPPANRFSELSEVHAPPRG